MCECVGPYDYITLILLYVLRMFILYITNIVSKNTITECVHFKNLYMELTCIKHNK